MINLSRTTRILEDSADLILRSKVSGCFFIDEDLLRENGVTNFEKYRVNRNVPDSDLMPDLFVYFE